MLSLTAFSRTSQRAACLLLSAIIVTVSLTLGTIVAQAPLHAGYSVTIEQLH